MLASQLKDFGQRLRAWFKAIGRSGTKMSSAGLNAAWHNARTNYAVVSETNTHMKTPLIKSSWFRIQVSNVCVIALLTTLAGCAHSPKRYAGAALTPIPASDIPADVTAPMPIRTVAPVYPYEMRRSGIQGWVEVLCLIDENGEVQNTSFLSATNEEFALSAVAATEKWSFAPGTYRGTRIPFRVVIPFNFEFSPEERTRGSDERLALRYPR